MTMQSMNVYARKNIKIYHINAAFLALLAVYINTPILHTGKWILTKNQNIKQEGMVGTFNQEVPTILLTNQWCYSMSTSLLGQYLSIVPPVIFIIIRYNRYQL